VLCYVLQVNEHVKEGELKELLEREIGPEAKESVMTAGQQLIEQGLRQGLQQGIEQGLQQGIEQGREQGIEQGRERLQGLLLNLLRQRFGDEVSTDVERRVETASIDQIEIWTKRVLSAATLADLLAD
jgi:flagellar biosynthesis/type III secretory pathway protein FliH